MITKLVQGQALLGTSKRWCGMESRGLAAALTSNEMMERMWQRITPHLRTRQTRWKRRHSTSNLERNQVRYFLFKAFTYSCTHTSKVNQWTPFFLLSLYDRDSIFCPFYSEFCMLSVPMTSFIVTLQGTSIQQSAKGLGELIYYNDVFDIRNLRYDWIFRNPTEMFVISSYG